MKVKIHKDAWYLPPWIIGLVIPGHMFLKRRPSDAISGRQRLYRHELTHVYQLKTLGSWGYLREHLREMIKYRSFWRYPLEDEADAQENEELTDQEWEWWVRGEINL